MAAVVQVVLLLVMMAPKVRHFDYRALLRSTLNCICCSALMGGALWLVSFLLELESGDYGKLALAGLVLAVILAAAGLYFLLSRLFGMEEGAMLLKGMRRKRS